VIGTAEQKRKLPAGWKWVKLGEVCTSKTGIKNPKDCPDKEFIYIDISSIDNEKKRIVSPNKMIGINAPSRARRLVYKDDIILSTTRPNLNAVAKVTDELDGQICSTGFCVLRPLNKIIDKDYLFLFCISPYLTEKLTDLVKGALYPAVTDKQVFAQEIPLPPLAEQKRIVRIMTEQMAAATKAKRACQEKLEAAEKLPEAFIRQVFPLPGKNLPDTWRWVKLDEVTTRISKGESPGWQGYDYVENGILFIRSENVRWGVFSRDPHVYIPESFHLKLSRSTVCEGDVLINLVGASIGRACVAPSGIGEANVNQAVAVVSCGSLLHNSYFVAFVISPLTQRYFETVQVEMARPNISLNNLRALKIPMPPLTEQKRIAGILTEQMAAAQKVTKTIEEELELINKLPASLLQQAFEGKL
jgi:type I restriction enzyme S subunit